MLALHLLQISLVYMNTLMVQDVLKDDTWLKRHFLFTWLKKEGIDDALIQPYSGHATRASLEIYSKLSLADAQPSYNQAMERFPIQ